MISTDLITSSTLARGLYSLDGFASIDDSKSKVIMEDGTLADPPLDHMDIYVFMYDIACKIVMKLAGIPPLSNTI